MENAVFLTDYKPFSKATFVELAKRSEHQYRLVIQESVSTMLETVARQLPLLVIGRTISIKEFTPKNLLNEATQVYQKICSALDSACIPCYMGSLENVTDFCAWEVCAGVYQKLHKAGWSKPSVKCVRLNEHPNSYCYIALLDSTKARVLVDGFKVPEEEIRLVDELLGNINNRTYPNSWFQMTESECQNSLTDEIVNEIMSK